MSCTEIQALALMKLNLHFSSLSFFRVTLVQHEVELSIAYYCISFSEDHLVNVNCSIRYNCSLSDLVLVIVIVLFHNFPLQIWFPELLRYQDFCFCFLNMLTVLYAPTVNGWQWELVKSSLRTEEILFINLLEPKSFGPNSSALWTLD